ncbi:MAG: DNA primase [Candidatus Zambryskibacteria bacterium RIFCSPHIGHO2_12_FULL_38_34]|uniref:DNA primase n=1 Tax=Candidatus Zambryskibacteria bacterium RIFCSPLOWO2_12_FULL_39_16 TaxID=1802775 RepID=A0A1G2URV6_9BACT|nr:MAG: DNA primase [Candidatus Zambryskibacteria bacterium RIFCSPHIGHO2_02_FULL_38_22]OHA97254.1 MAG: DNA primase [Candidatus Zambryskibacteria bacterium RIFCSPHIGHO2_12_FULL_38_34]OHB07573.1 MAG: DNA primase [Candidatus Zambryskibacteria bacterium RIFCSPLOWO2_02_FULL_38_13]OHB12123.1 MAG: DNA primase [Candidatus Zambryskibacteria bacterium RIFCSPLOWO2_12_FULL_39_16]
MSTDVEQIKERLDIVDVISSYLKVEKAGINFKAKCPFHNEKTPSFFISPTRQSFYCFGCGEKGDIFSFVEKFENLDFKGALETLAKRAGVELKNFKKEERSEEKDELFKIMEEATKIYEKQLTENKAVLKYLEKRGLSSPSISKWRLGFAKDEWRNLHDYLIGKGFSKENLLLAGLIKKAPEENRPALQASRYYDTFRNRVMFPISDSAGRVIAFSGRALKEDEKTPKYLNSPETKLFYKSEVLYGFNIAKNYIRKLDYAVLVEGQMDLLLSHQASVFNTVASSGTALTQLHLKKIQKLSNRVIIAYDSDSSGEKAARRAALMTMSLGMEAKITILPKGEDPASVIQNEPENWKKALRESEHFVDFALNKAVKENEGRNLTKEIIKNVLPLVSLIKSEMEKSQFVKKIALKIRVKEEDVWSDLKKIEPLREPANDGKKVQEYFSKKDLKTVSLERIVVSIIFLNESQKTKKTNNLSKKWREIVGNDKVTEILNSYEKEREALIFEAERYNEEGDINKISEDILRRIELENLKTELQQTTIIFDEKNLSKEKEKKVKSDIDKIQNRIKELNN